MALCSALLSGRALCQNAPAANPAKPEPVRTSITVVESIATDAPANITTLDTQRLQQAPGINIDDRLRFVPGFSNFRRSSSLVANPTTQGVSLRGIGSTGASRSLVLWDGIPINDPFGGWVYWTRVDSEEISRAEISRGASTSVFGDRALGGAIALFSRPAEAGRVHGSYDWGNRRTQQVTLGGSHVWQRWAASLNTRAFSTDGYYIVPERARGSADTQADVRFAAGDARLDWLGQQHRIFLKLDMLAEERDNGTQLQRNSTSIGNLAAHYAGERGNNGFSALAYHTREEFRASFSAIAADRNSERLTSLQTVPSTATGGAAYYQRRQGSANLLFGADMQRVEGESRDRVLPANTLRIGGGSLTQGGGFGQTNLRVGWAQFSAGVRQQFASRDIRFFSPSGGVVLGNGPLRVRASAYRAFRAPTLNELYREFRVGNAVTQANPELQPETLFGVEAGLVWSGEKSRAQVTLFRNELDDVITNVTLSTTPNQITRQRRNAATALSRGFEAEVEQQWGRVRGQASYLYADSRFTTRLRVPQVPRHNGSAQLTYLGGRTLASVGVRSSSLQFEDDINTFILPGFALLQASVRHRLTEGLSAQFALENAMNREYLVGYTPLPSVGSPRLWRVGLRWDGKLW